jgi:tRNA A-37 threonylcarbamoyl transferase component Bud32
VQSATGVMVTLLLAIVQRPRPFGVEIIGGWGGWATPSYQISMLTLALMGVLYTLVPHGHVRNIGKVIAAVIVTMAAGARMALGLDALTDVLVGAALGVAVPLAAFRFFTPSDVFPVRYRQGQRAHLDVTGERGDAIRRALEEQLGVQVLSITPVGLAGSAASTPLRVRVAGEPQVELLAKLMAQSHLRSDRWYKLGRELLYGRLEDEKPFNTVRRLVQQEDYALHKLYLAGLPTPRPYGVVELTPEREYLLVTEFFDGAVELGEAELDDQLIDEGLQIIRKLWAAGLAHRDIKPANLLVRGGHLLLIDVFFTEVRPTPWRQAVDLANMMLCLALQSNPERVYQRALRQFSVAEISEGFAAARGLALPSQLRRMLRAQGRDLHAEFVRLLPTPPRPIRIQRWSGRRIALLLLLLPVAVLLVPTVRLVLFNDDPNTTRLEIHDLDCQRLEPLWLQAQSVPSASRVPCVRPLPGWTVAGANARNGWSEFTLNHDRAGDRAVIARLTATCHPSGAAQLPSDQPGVRHYQQTQRLTDKFTATWYDVFPGGCVTYSLQSSIDTEGIFATEAALVRGYVTRQALQQALDERSNGQLSLRPTQAK